MACETNYNLDKPHVAIALLLSILILGHAGYEIVKSLMTAPQSKRGLEMPTPMDDKEIQDHHTELQGQLSQDSTNDG